MKRGKMIGWNFLRSADSFNADGSSTLDSLNSEKRRLEQRLVDIPKSIANYTHKIGLIRKDVQWLSSLSRSHKRSWEKKHGITTEKAIYDGNNNIANLTASINSLKIEKSRIPDQINSIEKQLDALVKGESKGLEKGLDKESAKELGKIEIEKQRQVIQHEKEMQQQELIAEQENQKAKSKKGLFIGIGITILLVIIGYVIYRKQVALKTT